MITTEKNSIKLFHVAHWLNIAVEYQSAWRDFSEVTSLSSCRCFDLLAGRRSGYRIEGLDLVLKPKNNRKTTVQTNVQRVESKSARSISQWEPIADQNWSAHTGSGVSVALRATLLAGPKNKAIKFSFDR